MNFNNQFDAVVCWGNVVGYTTQEADVRLLRALVRALIPGGTILLDLHNSVFYRTRILGKAWHELCEYYLLEDCTFDQVERRLLIRSIVVPKAGGKSEEYSYRLLHYEPEEVRTILEQLGFFTVTFYGDAKASGDGLLFSADGYGEQSHIMIASATKDAGSDGVQTRNR